MNEMFSQGGKGSTGILTNKQAVARHFGVKQSEVVYFSVGALLTGYKVIYDKVSQRAYSLPADIGSGVTAVSLSPAGVLVHSDGNVDLGALAVAREEYVTLPGSFATGVTVNTKNELVVFTDGKYRWDGELPKEVPAGATPASTGGFGLGAWVSVGDASLRSELVKVISTFKSLSEMINLGEKTNGKICDIVSYHEGKNRGGGRFVYSELTDKSLHDGGYIIDPDIAIPALSNFNQYLLPKNSGKGVWIRQKDGDILASEFGALPVDEMKWNCACINAALKRAQKHGSSNGATVRVENGKYYTTDAIINTSVIPGNRCPALKGGDSFLDVEIIKTTTSTVGGGYLGEDVDAVIYVSPTKKLGNYVIGEHISGFTLSHTTPTEGYGYYAHRSAIAYRGNLFIKNNYHNMYQNDCWQSTFGEIWCIGGYNGFYLIYGTSCKGGPIYSDGAANNGFSFYSLTYSDLLCACDGNGHGNPNGGVAYNFELACGVSGSYSTESCKGVEFKFGKSLGITINGRSLITKPVETEATKIWVDEASASKVTFDGYDWSTTMSPLSDVESSKYTFCNQTKFAGRSSIKFDNCAFSNKFASNGFIFAVSNKTPTVLSYSGYTHIDGLMTRTMYVANPYSRVCYVGEVASFEFLTYTAIDPGVDRFCMFDNSKLQPKRFVTSAVSRDANNPTTVGKIYNNGEYTGTDAQIYIDEDGWIRIRHSSSFYSSNYRLIMSV